MFQDGVDELQQEKGKHFCSRKYVARLGFGSWKVGYLADDTAFWNRLETSNWTDQSALSATIAPLGTS